MPLTIWSEKSQIQSRRLTRWEQTPFFRHKKTPFSIKPKEVWKGLSAEADSRPGELADLGRALGACHDVASFLEELENQVPSEACKTNDRLEGCHQSGKRHDRLDDLSQSSH